MRQLIIYYLLYTLFFLFSINSMFAQEEGDPFGIDSTGNINVEANDVFLLWLQGGHSYQKMYDLKFGGATPLPPDSSILKSPRQVDGRYGVGQFTDVAKGKFNVGPYENVVAIWPGENLERIYIMIPVFDTTEAKWTESIKDSLNVDVNDRIYVRTGNFDEDNFDEFVISNVSTDDSINFYVYDVDSTLHPSMIATFSDEIMTNIQRDYFIESGDFNGDGKDEILLQNTEYDDPDIGIYVKIYEINGTEIVPKSRKTILTANPNNLNDINVAISSGQFKDDPKDEIAFVCVSQGPDPSYADTAHIYLLEVRPDWEMGSRGISEFLGYVQESIHLSLATGDLNDDGRDEVVFLSMNKIYVYAMDDFLNLYQTLTKSVPQQQDEWLSYSFLKIADVNMGNGEDIVFVGNYHNSTVSDGFYIEMIAVNSDLDSSIVLGILEGDESNSYPYAISIGNFDGLNFTLGQPTRYSISDIVAPLVIINAPPVHFDMFGQDIYDINNCYNGGDCDFVATYKKQTTTSVEVKSEVHRDWTISAGLKAAGSLGDKATIDYEVWAYRKWGRQFSNTNINNTTITIGFEVEAREDDRIYATVADYDYWEYPVFHGNETFPRRSFLAIVPSNIQSIWFGSKSYNAIGHVPDHEIGNILSYQSYDSLVLNTNLSQVIAYFSDGFVIDYTSSYDWFVTIEDFVSNQADTVKEKGFNGGLEIGVFFSYEGLTKEIISHTTTVTELIDLGVHLGSLATGIGSTEYKVTPYAYWSKDGTLVVDYAVDPVLAPPGYPPTWWQEMYGNHSDPAFILPWRLDPEKGFPLEPSKRFLTKDIIFSSIDPKPGDTLTITVQLRNFGLIPTPIPVAVKFYIGDPDSGGTPIIGVNGTNTVSTESFISALNRSSVKFKWVIPEGLPSFPRIYAVLDQENAISEIHENNNKGFNVLGRFSVPTDLFNEFDVVPEEYVLYQSFPNPFNPTATIKYSIPKSDIVSIKVYDILGSEVSVLTNEYKMAGTYSVEFNASRFASGVYFYQIRAGNFVETKKMVLLK